MDLLNVTRDRIADLDKNAPRLGDPVEVQREQTTALWYLVQVLDRIASVLEEAHQ